MYSKLILTILLFLFFTFGDTAEHAWSYSGETGPSHWGGHCKGIKQSPINIIERQTDIDEKLATLDLTDFTKLSAMNLTLRNNGHTVQVDIPKTVRISGGGLPEKYVAAQLHFHWGGSDDRGSEHLLNGESFPFEMHIVHYAESRGSVKNAMDKKNGLAVLGIFSKIGAYNQHLRNIIDNIGVAATKDSQGVIRFVNLGGILQTSSMKYFRYHGSLTTPSCFESVIWSVFKTPIELSPAQMSVFRNVVKSSSIGEPAQNMVDNFRPVQALHGRRVYRSPDVVIVDANNKGYDNGVGGSGAFSTTSYGQMSVIILAFYYLFCSN